MRPPVTLLVVYNSLWTDFSIMLFRTNVERYVIYAWPQAPFVFVSLQRATLANISYGTYPNTESRTNFKFKANITPKHVKYRVALAD